MSRGGEGPSWPKRTLPTKKNILTEQAFLPPTLQELPNSWPEVRRVPCRPPRSSRLNRCTVLLLLQSEYSIPSDKYLIYTFKSLDRWSSCLKRGIVLPLLQSEYPLPNHKCMLLNCLIVGYKVLGLFHELSVCDRPITLDSFLYKTLQNFCSCLFCLLKNISFSQCLIFLYTIPYQYFSSRL